VAISSHQQPSAAISSHQQPSMAISGQQCSGMRSVRRLVRRSWPPTGSSSIIRCNQAHQMQSSSSDAIKLVASHRLVVRQSYTGGRTCEQ
jgi:hypothetical protein